jgi:hypothetical protein
MAQFVPYVSGITVAAYSVSIFIGSMGRNKIDRMAILEKHGIATLENDKWYPYEQYLGAIKEIAQTVGEMNLYLMGIASVKNTPYRLGETLQEALSNLNGLVHMQHRLNGVDMFNQQTGEMLPGLGEFALKEFDAQNRRAVVVTSTAYSSKTEEGALFAMAQIYEPNSKFLTVKEDITKPRKTQGGDSTTFLICW